MWNLQRICGPKSVEQAKITRGGPIQYNLYILFGAIHPLLYSVVCKFRATKHGTIVVMDKI